MSDEEVYIYNLELYLKRILNTSGCDKGIVSINFRKKNSAAEAYEYYVSVPDDEGYNTIERCRDTMEEAVEAYKELLEDFIKMEETGLR